MIIHRKQMGTTAENPGTYGDLWGQPGTLGTWGHVFPRQKSKLFWRHDGIKSPTQPRTRTHFAAFNLYDGPILITFTYPDGSEYVVSDNRFGDYASPGTAQKIMRLVDGVISNGHPEMDVYDRAAFISINSRQCRNCGCSENNPCIASEGNCSWAEADLCSHCQAGVRKVIRAYGN